MSTSKLVETSGGGAVRSTPSCAICGAARAHIYRTERFSETYVVRYYKCRKCSKRFKVVWAAA